MLTDAERLTTANALRDQLHTAVTQKRQAEHDIALLLRKMAQNRVYRALGYISLNDYALQEHTFHSGKTRALLKLADAMIAMPALEEALTSGLLSWTKAREVGRVATSETVGGWIEHAAVVTNRTLEAVVKRSGDGDTAAEALARPQAQEPLRRHTVNGLTHAEYELVTQAITRIRVDSNLTLDEFSPADALVAMARTSMEAANKAEPNNAIYRQLVVHVCADCAALSGARATHPDSTELSMAQCDGEIIDMRPGPTRGYKRKTIRPAVRQAVLTRDHDRCSLPTCRNTLWIDVHHIIPKSQGGSHQESNLLSLCGQHHRLLHDGQMALEPSKNGHLIAKFANGRTEPIPQKPSQTNPQNPQ